MKNLLATGLLGAAIGFAVGYFVGGSHLTASLNTERMGSMAAEDAITDSGGRTAMTMNPEPVAVEPAAPVPSVTIVETIPDMMGAYSIRVALENFTITPALIDQPPIPNEGHLHVYVDGEKVGREYAEWIYIPAEHFVAEGPHRITVSLNANTHAAWTFADSPIEHTVQVE